jgi:small Trp-rich protein
MLFIVIGLLLIGLKFADVAPVANLSWWWVLAPFALAAAWWAYADGSGLTKRREMDKLEDKKKERRQKAMDALGIDRNRQKREDAAASANGRAGWLPTRSRTRAPRSARRTRRWSATASSTIGKAPVSTTRWMARRRRSAEFGYSKRSSTAPWLALAALNANLASTPRV